MALHGHQQRCFFMYTAIFRQFKQEKNYYWQNITSYKK